MAKKQKDLFGDFIKGLTRRFDFELWPDCIFFFRGEEVLFEYNLNSGNLWCDWDKVWKVLECEGRYNYYEVQSFIKKQVEEHFRMMGVTPKCKLHPRWKVVEEHFKINSKQNKPVDYAL